MKKVPISKGKYLAIIDDIDYDRIKKYKWSAYNGSHASYAKAYIDGKYTFMHRYILGLKTGDKKRVDHINHDGLDNRRKNLRICTQQQNLYNMGIAAHNTSGYKGVYWHKHREKWVTGFKMGGKRVHLGIFEDKHMAAKMYNCCSRILHGEFAYQNKLPEGY